jgi:hypothetical protein
MDKSCKKTHKNQFILSNQVISCRPLKMLLHQSKSDTTWTQNPYLKKTHKKHLLSSSRRYYSFPKSAAPLWWIGMLEDILYKF